jgi:hypothetical protein
MASGYRGIVVDSRVYPVAGVKALEGRLREERIALPLHWGGYVMWHFPLSRVAIDGRNVTFYHPQYIASYMQAYNSGNLSVFAANSGVALVEANSAMASALSHSANWRISYKDKVTVVAVASSRSEPKWAHLSNLQIRKWEQFP